MKITIITGDTKKIAISRKKRTSKRKFDVKTKKSNNNIGREKNHGSYIA